MKDDRVIYTGQLTYKEVEFTFVFDGLTLKLLTPKEKRIEIEYNWLSKSIAEGVYVPNIPKIETSYLSGVCNDSGEKIVFFVGHGCYLSGCNSALTVDVIAYIICKYDKHLIDRISFTSPEIDAIHPINKAFSISIDGDFKDFSQSGVFSITTKDFDSTTTRAQEFVVDGKKVATYFSVLRGVSFGVGEAPISLNSCLMFTFEPTEDYEFILRLWSIAKDFLSFLCYRRDVYLQTVKLASPYADGKHKEFATLYVVGEDGSPSVEVIQKGRYIKQGLIAGHEGQILMDIAEKKLYLRHIPESFNSGQRKDEAKFIMLTSAFEWEFRRTYPNGVKKSEEALSIEKTATEAIENLFNSSTGKLRDKYRYLKKRIKDDPLQSEIEQIGKDFAAIVNMFGECMYSLNGEKLVYSEMGKRLGDQRNHFAHGDLDEEFIDLSLLDLVFLERVVYAMQLKYYDIEIPRIQNAINDLFHCGFALPQT